MVFSRLAVASFGAISKRLCAGVFSAIALAGCVTENERFFSKLEPSASGPLPAVSFFTPQLGDRIVLSNGSVETVTSVNNGVYTSETSRGTEYAKSVLPMLSPVSWSRRERRGQNSVETSFATAGPLTADWRYDYTNTSEFVREAGGEWKTYVSTWRCAVADSGEVETIAGQFDAYVLRCEQRRKFSNIVRTITKYHIDAETGLVLRNSRFRVSSRDLRERELVAVVPDLTLRSQALSDGVSAQIQQVLEFSLSGETDIQRIDGVLSQITVHATVQNDGVFCRQFKHTLGEGSGARVYPGLRCRSEAGVWLVPGLNA